MSESGEFRAGESEALARVLVVSAVQSGRASAWAQALQGLDRGVTIEALPDARACERRCAVSAVDLVVLDGEQPPAEARALLDSLRAKGPPIVVVQPVADARGAAAWRAQGALACVEDDAAALLGAARACLAEVPASSEMEEGAEAYQAIVENLNSALVVVDGEGRIAYCNPPAEQILGAESDALQGTPAARWFVSDRDEGDLLERARTRGERFKAGETAVRRADGRVVPVGISCAPVRDSAGRINGAVALFQDLSEVTRLRTHVLQREKMASVGQLAAGVAHEINNPMGFIHANLFQMAEYVSDLRQLWSRVDVLSKAALAGDAEAARKAAGELASAAEHADVSYLLSDLAKAIRESQEGSERIRHIVQDLRDFSHADAGERVLADVNQCLDSTANIVWPMMKQVVVLEKDYAPLPEVPCYPMQLKQVFMNLLVNAYQAIEEKVGHGGGVGTIFLVTAEERGGVVVSVRDSGVGITEEHRRRIFEPFFSTKKVGAGMGLGLSTSFNLIERHGGSLTVESELGVGTTFRVFLPRLHSAERSGT